MIKNVYWYSCKVTVILMKLEFSRKIFENTQVIFHENPSSGIRVVPDRRPYIKKAIFAFPNFANAPKK